MLEHQIRTDIRGVNESVMLDESRNHGCLTALILIKELYNKTPIYKAINYHYVVTLM